MLESAHGWASERVFSRWVSKQEWRACLPKIFEFTVERVTLSNFMMGTYGVQLKVVCFISFGLAVVSDAQCIFYFRGVVP